MALRDIVSNQDLLRYLEEEHDLLMYYLETEHSDVIEGFLAEYNQEFMEWIESDGEVGRI